MSSGTEMTSPVEPRALLSTLWVFLSVNYIYCDHLGILEPDVFSGLMAGQIGSVQINPGFLLSAALMLQIPFVMIVLARVLPQRPNRWANMFAGAVMIVIQIGTLSMGTTPSPVYLFYSGIEFACNLFIILYVWKWAQPEAAPATVAAPADR